MLGEFWQKSIDFLDIFYHESGWAFLQAKLFILYIFSNRNLNKHL